MKILALTFFLLSTASIGYAHEGSFGAKAEQKQEEKKSSRWTLEGWLAQKEQIRMSDRWLAKNSHSSPFEFFTELRSVNYNRTDGTPNAPHSNENIYGTTLAAYAGNAGLRGTFDQDSLERNMWSGSLNLRLLGTAIQDTHINLEYGIRGSHFGSLESQKFSNQFAGISMNFYLTKYLGIEGSYQKILSGEAEETGRKLQGEDSRAGLFLDFSIIRIFGNWRHELLQFSEGGVAGAREQRTGYGGGLRLYF
jgi:hypothetical protein